MIPSRAALFRWHSWLGLTTGVFMLVIAWSGSLAVFNDEIGWLLVPELRADPAGGQQPIDAVVAALRQRFPDRRFDLHLQSGPRWAHTAYVYERGVTTFVHIDPATARVTRLDAMEGYTWNVVYFIRQLHVRLLMGFWGRVFVGLFGVTLVLSIFTSLRIYRGWWTSLFCVRREHGRRIFLMDLHKLVGAWALLINLLFGVTGAVLGLENLYYRIWPRSAASPRDLPSADLGWLPAGLTPGAMAQALAAHDPLFVPTVIQITPAQSAVLMRGDHPGALIAKDASAYRVDLPTGRILSRQDARSAAWATYLYNTLDPLHFGYFGDKWTALSSYAIKMVWAVLGLTPGVLSITGAYMWWLRQKRATAAREARAALLPAQLAAARDSDLTRWCVAGLLPFLAAGYVLQASVWARGWHMSEQLWQHWIVKPVCLMSVAFPISLLALWAGVRVLESGRTRGSAMVATVPVGVLYLLAVTLFN